MILDCTSGNRNMWRTKESEYVIYVDVEKELEYPPDIICDSTKTPFLDEQFSSIFFDPPHGWGRKIGGSMTTLRNKKDLEEYKWKAFHNLAYWGWDKYKTKRELFIFLHKAQREFLRILKDDGALWVKWNEVNIPLRSILPFFKNWNEMLRLSICSLSQTIGKEQTYWIMFMKKIDIEQTVLGD